MKKIIFMFLLSSSLLVSGFSQQEQKRDPSEIMLETISDLGQQKKIHFYVGLEYAFERIRDLPKSGFTTSFSVDVGKKFAFFFGGTIYYDLEFNFANYEGLELLFPPIPDFNMFAFPIIKIISNKKINLIFGTGLKLLFTDFDQSQSKVKPFWFLKGVAEYNINKSLGIYAGLNQNVIFAALGFEKNLTYPNIECGLYFRK